jgi:hypothetical protein
MSWISKMLGRPEPDPKSQPQTQEEWAQGLAERKDYLTLAQVFDREPGPGSSHVQEIVRPILLDAGVDAVEAIMQVVAHESWGRQELGLLLVEIGDPRGVPLLKRLVDRGKYEGFPRGKGAIVAFVNEHSDGQLAEQRVHCAICGKDVAVSTARCFGRGSEEQWFCKEPCWKRRGEILTAELGECPFFREGNCTAGGGGAECSMSTGSYHECSLGPRR